MWLLSSVECFFLRYLKEFLWLVNLVLKVLEVRPTAFVRFVAISAGYCGLVYHRFLEALAEEWVFVGFSAVAFVIFWFIGFQKDRLVMAVNRLFDVGHTGVTDFHVHGISVEYFVQYMILMKFLV